jgi:WhiB family redox-sensing transcriptional regulator
VRNLQWTSRAACKGLPTEVFFPDHYRYDTARAVCSGCQVKGECLAFALEMRINKGMFGGLSPRQRTAVRRQREAA